MRMRGPIRVGVHPDATVTAGNSSGQNDGAALYVVTIPRECGAVGAVAARVAGEKCASVAAKDSQRSFERWA